MKTENWNGHKIRFVNINGEWWAVAKDVAEALGYAETRNIMKLVPSQYTSSCKMDDKVQKRSYITISEFGIYKAVFGSHKQEAEEFQEWVFTVIKQLRQSVGLEGFQVFRMLDKEHQKEAMAKLSHTITESQPRDYIKANTIANKAVSTIYGHSKMLKKEDMTPEMLVDREPILDETVELMAVKEKYGLRFSVSEKIYNRSAELQTA